MLVYKLSLPINVTPSVESSRGEMGGGLGLFSAVASGIDVRIVRLIPDNVTHSVCKLRLSSGYKRKGLNMLSAVATLI